MYGGIDPLAANTNHLDDYARRHDMDIVRFECTWMHISRKPREDPNPYIPCQCIDGVEDGYVTYAAAFIAA